MSQVSLQLLILKLKKKLSFLRCWFSFLPKMYQNYTSNNKEISEPCVEWCEYLLRLTSYSDMMFITSFREEVSVTIVLSLKTIVRLSDWQTKIVCLAGRNYVTM